MRYVVAVADATEDDAVLIGPFTSKHASEAIAAGIEERWNQSASVVPLFSSLGEYARLTEEAG